MFGVWVFLRCVSPFPCLFVISFISESRPISMSRFSGREIFGQVHPLTPACVWPMCLQDCRIIKGPFPLWEAEELALEEVVCHSGYTLPASLDNAPVKVHPGHCSSADPPLPLAPFSSW